MLEGRWDSVLPEGEEDVVCQAEDESSLAQVKTVEDPTQLWTASLVCRPETPGRIDTSILGRLFTGKTLSDETRFLLVTNERVGRDLRPLTSLDGGNRTGIEDDVVTRLEGLALDGRDVRWCVERLMIEECENTADGLEAQVERRLAFVSAGRGFPLLPNELSELLDKLLLHVQERSRDRQASPIKRDDLETLLDEWADRIQADTSSNMQSPDEALRPKLEAAGLDPEEIRRCEDMRIRFSRRRRAAVGRERTELDALVDEIAMACLGVKARRNAGDIEPGLGSVEAALASVTELHGQRGWDARDISLATAYGALHDVTGRCQNRYVDG